MSAYTRRPGDPLELADALIESSWSTGNREQPPHRCEFCDPDRVGAQVNR